MAGAAGARLWRGLSAVCLVVAIAGWVLLVLRDQYDVAALKAWPQPAYDALTLTGLAGAAFTRALARRTSAARWLLVFRIALLVVTTSASVVGAEYLLRFEFRHAQTSGNAGDYIAAAKRWDPGPANRFGFRDREVPPKSNRYRIVVIGDSFAWGQGIERDQRFADLMQAALGPGFEVFNFSIPGDNMPEHLFRLEQALRISPDFILLEIYTNDFETREMERPSPYPLLPLAVHEDLMQSSIFYTLLQSQWAHLQQVTGLTESYAHYMARNLSDPDAPNARKAYGQLREFFDRARQAGVPAGAVMFPATDLLGVHGATYPFGYLHDGVHATCDAEWVPCLDLLPMYTQFRDARVTWVSPFDAHPNALANRLAADQILRSFESIWRP